MANVHQTLKQVQNLQQRYLRAAIGQDDLLKLLYESEVAEQVYNSNAIENSTLTLEETDRILNQIDLDRMISERELFEARNLARVVGYIQKKAKKEELSINVMHLLHKMLLSNINDEIAGRFRSKDEWVRVGSRIAVSPADIERMIQDMLITYQISGQENIIKRIARFHLTFEHIHPFVDGNGRIGRVLNNYLLIREGHVPINIKFIDRRTYYEAFLAFDQRKDTKIMQRIVGNALSNSYHKRLAYLEGKTITTLAEYARSSTQSHSNLINKAKRQTIEAFWEKGVWKIGVDAVDSSPAP